jgi:4-amino-4-deoxychorismate lyase
MTGRLGTWVDGEAAEVVPADDRALHYGDGVFETLLVRERQARFVEAHLARLALGCERLGIPFVAFDELRAEILTACGRAPSLAVLKIIVTRGSATKRGYAPQGNEAARRVMTLFESAPLDKSMRRGVDLVLSSIRLADNPTLAGIKHLSRLENVLASREAREAGVFDAILRGGDDRIVCGAMTNIFAVRAGQVLTPAVDRAGVAGVLRAVVLRECRTMSVPAAEGTLTLRGLLEADEAFVTNARIGVVPVRRLGEHAFYMNQIGLGLATHIEALSA